MAEQGRISINAFIFRVVLSCSGSRERNDPCSGDSPSFMPTANWCDGASLREESSSSSSRFEDAFNLPSKGQSALVFFFGLDSQQPAVTSKSWK